MQAHIRQIRKKNTPRNNPQIEEPAKRNKATNKNTETNENEDKKNNNTTNNTERITRTRKRKLNIEPTKGTTKKKKEDYG